MKTFAIALFIMLISFSSGTYAQLKTYLGVNTGYGIMSMGDVNNELTTLHKLLNEYVYTAPPSKVNGGLHYEISLVYGLENILFGVSFNSISGSGNFSYTDNIGHIEEKFDVNTSEILGLIGMRIPMSNYTSIVLKWYSGYGMAGSEYKADLISYSSATNIFSSRGTLSRNYFSGKLQGGIDIHLSPVLINFFLGYRIANAGVLKGDIYANGKTYLNSSLPNSSGESIEFDFSGMIFGGGVQFEL